MQWLFGIQFICSLLTVINSNLKKLQDGYVNEVYGLVASFLQI